MKKMTPTYTYIKFIKKKPTHTYMVENNNIDE